MSGWFRAGPDGLTLHLRVTPNAGRDAVEGAESRDDGRQVLRLRVRAVPDRGKANAAVIGLLAETLGVPRSAISFRSGETGRLKTVLVAGPPGALARRAMALGGQAPRQKRAITIA